MPSHTLSEDKIDSNVARSSVSSMIAPEDVIPDSKYTKKMADTDAAIPLSEEDENKPTISSNVFTDDERKRRGGFDVSVAELCSLTDHGEEEANARNLSDLGRQNGLAERLKTDLQKGICSDHIEQDLANRREIFSDNRMPERPFQSFFSLLVDAFKDLVLIILIIAAIISLGIGIYEALEHGENSWVDGVAIIIAVIIVSFVTAGNDYKKQLQFLALERSSDAEMRVKVVRNNKKIEIHTPDVVVGDIIELEGGDQVPADGICIVSDKCKLSAANLTGESIDLECDPVDKPVVLSGMQVSDGTCRIIAVAVGERSMQGRIRKGTAQETKDTPLQEKLEIMVKHIGYIGLAASILTFVAMMIMIGTSESVVDDAGGVGRWVLQAFIIMITIIVVAIPEGLPLAVTISLAYSTMKMMKDKNLVRVLAACETMGNATDICSDKTGTLTQNRMTVVHLYAPDKAMSLRNADTSAPPSSGDRKDSSYQLLPESSRDILIEHMCLNTTAFLQESNDAKKREAGLLEVTGSKTAGAGLFLARSTCLDPEEFRNECVYSGRYLKHHLFESKRKMASTVFLLPSEHSSGKKVRILITGAPEFVLSRCVSWLRFEGNVESLSEDHRNRVKWNQREMAKQALRTLAYAYKDLDSMEDLPGYVECPESYIKSHANDMDNLSAYDRVKLQEKYYQETNQEWYVNPDSVENWDSSFDPSTIGEGGHVNSAGFTFYAMVGIEDPLRPDVRESVATCLRAGIRVRMVTGDNRDTAEAIAKQCGILTEGGLVVEGPAFRRMSPTEIDRILPRLQVMARSSPEDKNWLVKRLNGNVPQTEQEWCADHPGAEFTEANWRKLMPGYIKEWEESNYNELAKRVYRPVVGVTGDGTNDAPALKAADVGLSMGIGGTDVARNASDIVILDDNFASIVKSVMWGRSVYDNIRKFLQFQLTVNVVALSITFLAAVTQKEPPLNAVMMLWVNLIMDSLGALALGTEPPTAALLDREPYVSHASLLSPKMWRHILMQSAFQLVLLLVLLLTEGDGFKIDRAYVADYMDKNENDLSSEDFTKYLNTFIFNAFVFCQVFNEFNARSIGDEWNVARGLHKNKLFLGVIVFTLLLQLFIIEVGGDFTNTTGLTAEHWGMTIGLGAIALPVGILMRFIPAQERPADFAGYYLVSAADAAANEAEEAQGKLAGGSSPRKTSQASGRVSPGEASDVVKPLVNPSERYECHDKAAP